MYNQVIWCYRSMCGLLVWWVKLPGVYIYPQRCYKPKTLLLISDINKINQYFPPVINLNHVRLHQDIQVQIPLNLLSQIRNIRSGYSD